ncbi:hypothetical protein ON010_g12439 [Phytophthora cinnamomi]|nr:hypothetical protein ON010_g12439 [Phytophthora cinnamomi]
MRGPAELAIGAPFAHRHRRKRIGRSAQVESGALRVSGERPADVPDQRVLTRALLHTASTSTPTTANITALQASTLGSGASSAAAQTSWRRSRTAAPCRPASKTTPGHQEQPWGLSEPTARNCTALGTRAADYRPFCCGLVAFSTSRSNLRSGKPCSLAALDDGLTTAVRRLECRLLKSAEVLNGPAPVGKVPATRRTVSNITAWRLHQVQHNLALMPTSRPQLDKTGPA